MGIFFFLGGGEKFSHTYLQNRPVHTVLVLDSVTDYYLRISNLLWDVIIGNLSPYAPVSLLDVAVPIKKGQ